MSETMAGSGWEDVQKESQRRERMEEREYLPFFALDDGEEAKVRILNSEPYTFYQHFVQRMSRTFVCLEENCPLCNIGNKPSFRGGFLVIDYRVDKFTDSEGKEQERQYTLKEMNMSHSTLKVMKNKHDKYGLTNHDWIITRTGTGTNTRYDFERQEKEDIPMPDEIPDIEKVYMAPDRDWLLQEMASSGLGQPANQGISVNEDEDVVDFD